MSGDLCERSEAVAGNERRGRAAGERVVGEFRAAAERHEQVAGHDPPRVGLHSRELVLARVNLTKAFEE